MTISMEAKKHALQQLQDGSWKVTFTVHADDMSLELIQAAMGAPYGLAIAPIQYDDTPPNMDHFTGYKENSNATTKIAPEKSEGEKLRQRACMLCQDPKFAEFLDNTHYSLAELNSQASKECLYEYCGILSRKELVLNVNAQIRFKDLDRQYKEWLNPIDEQYKDNLSRG